MRQTGEYMSGYMCIKQCSISVLQFQERKYIFVQ